MNPRILRMLIVFGGITLALFATCMIILVGRVLELNCMWSTDCASEQLTFAFLRESALLSLAIAAPLAAAVTAYAAIARK